MAVALIVAAGRGERLGSGRPKALVPLCGRPMLEWSVAALRAVAAVAADRRRPAGDGARRGPGGHDRGGRRRPALAFGARGAGRQRRRGPGDRPRRRPAAGHAELFEQALEELERSRGRRGDRRGAGVRHDQGDRRRRAHGGADAGSFAAVGHPDAAGVPSRRAGARAGRAPTASWRRATDDAWLVEQAGGIVRILGSDPGNLKVTTPEDLRVAELLLRAGRTRASGRA